MKFLRLLQIALVLIITIASPAKSAAPETTNWVGLLQDMNTDSIVYVQTLAKLRNGLPWEQNGTGFIVHPDGYVMTCKHLFPDPDKCETPCKISVNVGSPDGEAQSAVFVRSDREADLALIRLPQHPSKPWRALLPLMSDPQIGTTIVAFGFPKTNPLVGVVGSILTRNSPAGPFWSTNAATDYGMSGGPVFDFQGSLAGVVNGGFEGEERQNTILPIGFCRELLQMIHSPLIEGYLPDMGDGDTSVHPNASAHPYPPGFTVNIDDFTYNGRVYRVERTQIWDEDGMPVGKILKPTATGVVASGEWTKTKEVFHFTNSLNVFVYVNEKRLPVGTWQPKKFDLPH